MEVMMTLGRIIAKIPQNQKVIVKDFYSSKVYAQGISNDRLTNEIFENEQLTDSYVQSISVEKDFIVLDITL